MTSFHCSKTCDSDTLAEELISWGRFAKRWPPCWDGAEISIPICGSDGAFIGRMLPGKGIYLDYDLHRVTPVKEKLPGVFERTAIQRLWDVCRDNRGAIAAAAAVAAATINPAGYNLAAITTYDGIIAARGGGKAFDVTIAKASYTTVANVWSSMYQAGGIPPAGTYTAITGGAAHTRASTGAWSLGLVNPTNPDKKYLLSFGYASVQQLNWAILHDLLVCAGSISTQITTSQTINSTALTRYTDGKGVMMTYAVETALGTTQGAMATGGITYTDQDGNSSNITGGWISPASCIANRLVPTDYGPFSLLASGDYGVRSVETFQLSTAHADPGTDGTLALNLYFPLTFMPGISANAYLERDVTTQIDGLVELVQASAVLGCLNLYVMTNTTSTGVFTGFIRTCDG